ncbi:hypothetical protein [Desulfovibrio piger]|uniref:hypothetical protein n=1 Tax=Desulfovibrio piger TaxID=901 RepID=UPI00242DD8D8|nr:hypothetical protein [Desulfovibrio piger]
MSGAISFWCNAIALSSVVVVISCLLSSVFHKPLLFGIAATLSVAGACCASFLLGAVGILWALERGEAVTIPARRVVVFAPSKKLDRDIRA